MSLAGEAVTVARCCGALVGTVPRLVRPRPRLTSFLAGLPDVPPPAARAEVTVRALVQATTTAPTAVVVEGQLRPRTVDIAMATFVVSHPGGTFLVDPALSADVRERVLVPEMTATLRALMAPAGPIRGLAEALAADAADVPPPEFALATHLHWDHVCGLAELPGVPLHASAAEIDGLASAPATVFLRSSTARLDLRPYDLDGPPVLSFARSRDWFGDGSVLLVDLGGHTAGSVGVLLATAGGPILLAGDAAWNAGQVARLRQKAPLPGRLVDGDRDETFRTLHRLHRAAERVTVVPGHDLAAITAAMPTAA